MTNLLTAIANKISGSALAEAVANRIWLDDYQDDPPVVYPYIIYFVVTAPKEKTFTEVFTNPLIQFSIFSASSSAVEISGIYDALTALFDECSLSITGNTLVWCIENNLTTMTDEVETPQGTTKLKHWAVDFEFKTSLN
jgi:hypothetical protein